MQNGVLINAEVIIMKEQHAVCQSETLTGTWVGGSIVNHLMKAELSVYKMYMNMLSVT